LGKSIQEKENWAVSSKLGWMLHGPCGDGGAKQNGRTSALLFRVSKVACPENEFDLSNFWNLEGLGILPEDDIEVAVTYESLESRITKTPRGRYKVPLP